MEEDMKKIYKICIIVSLLVLDAIYIYQAFATQTYHRLATYLAVPFLVVLPWVYEKITKKPLNENLKLIYYTFIFIADGLGCVVDLYETTSWFDIFAHYLSGVLTAFLAIVLMKVFRYKETWLGILIYSLAVSCLVAVVWKIFEFGMDTIFGMNLQHVVETGIHDTMEDILAAVIGAISFLICYLATNKKGKLHKFIEDVI